MVSSSAQVASARDIGKRRRALLNRTEPQA
jgi:hypothetical protein